MHLGNILIILAVAVSLIAMFFQVRSASGNKFALVTSKQIYYMTSIIICFAVILLFNALIGDNFQLAYVYNNSSKELHTIYKIAAFWAGNQGSFLLWLFIINIFGIVILKSNDEYENILMLVITITQMFFLIILLVDSPFKYIWEAFPETQPGFAPQDGAGMNRLLVDPWMISHPPILFLGYASALIPFGYAIAALLKKDYAILTEKAYKWVLFSVVTLGIGIFLGGYWAYKVLGWGGYWGWDPVENSSLIPWLVVTALMHGLIIQKRKSTLIKTNLSLALVFFILVFYSTFLTRSGLLSDFSVHSFADYGLTPYLVSFMLFYIIISVLLFAVRFKEISSKNFGTKVWSWDILTLYGILILIFFTTIIFGGTSMPIFSGIFLENPTNVTTSFYNNIAGPFGALILILMVLSTISMTSKKFINIPNCIIIGLSLLMGILFNIFYVVNIAVFIISSLAFYAIFNYIYDLFKNRSLAILSSRIAHLGIGVLVIGIVASNFHTTTLHKKLILDKSENIDSINLTFKGFKEAKISTLQFSLQENSKITNFETEYNFNDKTKSIYREPHIINGFLGDIYIIPETYTSGVEESTRLILHKNEMAEFSGFKFMFTGFNAKNMGSGIPEVLADIKINGKKIETGIKIINGHRVRSRSKIPGTDRAVSLFDFDIKNSTILLHIAPGKNTVIPPDSVIVDISYKRLIWLVWAGTILIAAGGIIAFFRLRNSKS